MVRDAQSESLIEAEPLDIAGVGAMLVEKLRMLIGERRCRISLIPFGPKRLVVGAIPAMLDVGQAEADVMYPIPTSYNSEYSRGVREMYSYVVDGVGVDRGRGQWAVADRGM